MPAGPTGAAPIAVYWQYVPIVDECVLITPCSTALGMQCSHTCQAQSLPMSSCSASDLCPNIATQGTCPSFAHSPSCYSCAHVHNCSNIAANHATCALTVQRYSQPCHDPACNYRGPPRAFRDCCGARRPQANSAADPCKRTYGSCVNQHQPTAQHDHPCQTLLICMLLLLAGKILRPLTGTVPAGHGQQVSLLCKCHLCMCCVNQHQPTAQSDHPCQTLLTCMLLLLAVTTLRSLIAAVPAGHSQQLS
jgi:hypothetical protein